jgi:hypothetical protein
MKYLGLLIIIILDYIVMHLRNLVYVRKVKILEELLDSKLHCHFSVFFPTVKIKGKYKDKIIEFRSYTHRILYRVNTFVLWSSKLPKLKKFMIHYPLVTYNIRQYKDSLRYRAVRDFFTWRISKMGKAGICAILDELVEAADRIECSNE